jgi:hypothetical protein
MFIVEVVMMKNKIESLKANRLFQKAMLEAARVRSPQLMDEVKDDPYEPSARFTSRINQMIRSENERKSPFSVLDRLYSACSRAAEWALIVILLMLIIVPNVAAARDWVTKLVMDSNPEYVTYYLQSNQHAAEQNFQMEMQKTLPLGAYYPTYLPEGMKLTTLQYSGDAVLYQFEDGSDNLVTIEVLGSGSTVNIDNENLEEKSIEVINGIEAHYSRKNGVSFLIWSDDDLVFNIITTLSKKELLQISSGLTANQ